MVERVQAHIKKLNWGYKVELAEKDVKYYNCLATLVNKNTIELLNRKGEKEQVTAKHILVAVGGRPTFLDIPNTEKLVITSDDLFSMQ